MRLYERRKIHGHHDLLGVGALSAAEEASLALRLSPRKSAKFLSSFTG